MRRRLLAISAALLATVTTLAACGDSSDETTQPHNKADVTFAQQMIPHHQQAVQMGDIVLAKQGIDPEVMKSGQYPPAVAMAHSIVTGQQQEITDMQAMLASR